MKNKSLHDKVISLMFIIFLVFPLATSLLTKDKTKSTTEKRRLANLPELHLSKESIQKFPDRFEKYYNDHFGFRNRFIKFHNYIKYSLFNASPSPAVNIGRDGWLFLNVADKTHDYLGSTTFDEVSLAKFSQVLKDRESWLQSLGSQYLYLPIPNKSTVYEEYLPEKLRKYRGATKYEQVTNYLTTNSDFSAWIDTRKILEEKKNSLQVYYKTDTHWNYDGAYEVYLEIIKNLRQWFPELTPVAASPEKKWSERKSGDLARLMNLRKIVVEKAPLLNLIQQCNLRDLSPVNSILEIPQYQEINRRYIPIEHGCDSRQRTALLIHDSFGNLLKPLLGYNFSKIFYVHYFNFETIKSFIERERPDVVMDLRVSRNLENGLKFDEELEQYTMAKGFNNLGQTLMRLDHNSATQYINPTNKAVSIDNAGRLQLLSTDGQQLADFSFYQNNEAGPLAIEVDIQSAVKTDIIFSYAIATERDAPARKHQEVRSVEPGRQKLYLRILHPKTLGQLQLRPVSPGEYTLYSLTVKKL